jgi:glycosyltransferase involved in cell wall biosynthesis
MTDRRPVRVGINLLQARPEIGGGWNYTESILASLGQCGRQHDYVLFVNPQSRKLAELIPRCRIVDVAIDPNNAVARIWFDQVHLPSLARREAVDCLFWLGAVCGLAGSTPSVVTLHDLKMFDLPDQYGFWKRTYLQSAIRRSASRATLIACVSHATAAAAKSRLHIPPEKLRVVPYPLRENFVPASPIETAAFRRRYNLPERFWLYVAHVYPHKNHSRLFEAYARVLGENHGAWPLVLCGRTFGEDFSRTFQELGIGANVIWLPYLPDEDIPLLYSSASALVFPSLYEGGGIPVMEALACGCPVIASDLPTTREFAGRAVALTFDGLRTESIAEAMLRFAANHEDFGRDVGIQAMRDSQPAKVASVLTDAFSTAASASR